MSISSTGLSRDERKGRLAGAANPARGPPLTVSVRRACAVGRRRHHALAMIKNGQVATIKIGRKRLIIYSSLEKLVSSADDKQGGS
jgi:hypothetical protein